MDIQVSLIGLGQIGSSLGLALGPYAGSITRVGYDRNPDTASEAKELGAVDRVAHSLPGAIQEADVVLLALPMHEIYPTLNDIAGEVKEGAIVIDTAPIKQVVREWAENSLPDSAQYVGFTPVINPEYLHEDQFGIQAARPDLFEGGMIAVVSGGGVRDEVIRISTNLIEMVGAEPFFVDAVEIDGLMTMTYIMPRVLAASLLNATLGKPGWRDGRKIAGRAYARVSGPLTPVDEPASLANIVIHNKENVVRIIDDVIRTLRDFRDDVDDGKEDSLLKMLNKVQQGRDAWWRERQSSPSSLSGSSGENSPGNILKHLFGFGFSNRTEGHDEE